jgi:hypothetical protein
VLAQRHLDGAIDVGDHSAVGLALDVEAAAKTRQAQRVGDVGELEGQAQVGVARGGRVITGAMEVRTPATITIAAPAVMRLDGGYRPPPGWPAAAGATAPPLLANCS